MTKLRALVIALATAGVVAAVPAIASAKPTKTKRTLSILAFNAFDPVGQLRTTLESAETQTITQQSDDATIQTPNFTPGHSASRSFVNPPPQPPAPPNPGKGPPPAPPGKNK